jgi:Tol biopolymer transport system component
LTFDTNIDHWAIWSPDGNRIVFDSGRNGPHNLFQKSSTGAGIDEMLLESPDGQGAADWSADGRFVLYEQVSPKTGGDLWVLPMASGSKPQPFLTTPFEERNGQFSPDGRWVAYESNESGRAEIYVRPFPGTGGQWQVSTAGGTQARWRNDGRELSYYIAPDGKLMAVSIAVKGTGATTAVEVGAPESLFPARTPTAFRRQQYDVSADGRFLVNASQEDATAPSITLLLNWKPKL